MTRTDKWVSWILTAAAVFSLWTALLEMRDRTAVDFYQYRAAGEMISRNAGDVIYAPGSERLREWSRRLRSEAQTRNPAGKELAAAAFRPELEFYSSPLLFTLFSPFSRLGFAAALGLYRILIAGALAAFFILAGPPLGWRGWKIPAALGLAAVLFSPWRIDLLVGNVNTLQLAGIGLAFRLLTRIGDWGYPFLPGAVLGLLVLFKPALAPTLPLAALAFLPRFRDAGRFGLGALAGAAAGLAASLWGFPDPGAWTDWIRALRAMPPETISPAKGNFSPALMLSEAAGLRLFTPLALAAFALAGGAVLRGNRGAAAEKTPVRAAGAICLGIAAFLLGSPLVWVHYSVLALPAALFLISPEAGMGSFWKAAAALATALTALAPLNLCGFGGLKIDLTATVAGLFGLYLLLLFALTRRASRHPHKT